MENSIGIDPNVNHEIQELLSSRHPDRYWNGFLVPKEYNAFLWKKHKVSQYFKDRTIGKLVPLSCEMQLSFFIEVIFLHKSWNLISRDNYKTNCRFYNNTSIFKTPQKTWVNICTGIVDNPENI